MSALSLAAGLTRGHVEQIEKLRVKGLEAGTVDGLAQALDCTPAELWGEVASPIPRREIAYDDPEPNRPAALALLRGLVDVEVLEALRSLSNKQEEPRTVDAWVDEGMALQRGRNRIRAELARPPVEEAPRDLRAELAERAKKTKRR